MKRKYNISAVILDKGVDSSKRILNGAPASIICLTSRRFISSAITSIIFIAAFLECKEMPNLSHSILGVLQVLRILYRLF